MCWFKTLSEKVTCTVSGCCVFVSFYSPPLHAPFTVLFFSLATLIPPKAIFHLDSFRAGHWERSCAGGDRRNAILLGTCCAPGKYCVFLSALPTLASQFKLLLAILAELTALGLFWLPHSLIWKCIIKYVISCCHCECIFITKLKNNIMIFYT